MKSEHVVKSVRDAASCILGSNTIDRCFEPRKEKAKLS